MGTEIPENNSLLTRPTGPHVIWPFCLFSFPTIHFFSPNTNSLKHTALFSDASPSLLCLVHSYPLFREAFHDHPVTRGEPCAFPTFHLVATVSMRISVCPVPGEQVPHRQVRTDLSKYPGSHVLTQDRVQCRRDPTHQT